MTAREIFEQKIISPFDPKTIGPDCYISLFESYQDRQIRMHEDKATIEGGEIYYPKAITELKYEIANKAPILFHLWTRYYNLGDNFLSNSELSNLLNWIDARLDDAGTDDFRRKQKEEEYEHELWHFVNNYSIILQLKKRLSDIEQENGNTDNKFDKLPDFTKIPYFQKIYQALKVAGVISGGMGTFVNMCVNEETPPQKPLKWLLVASRSKKTHYRSLCEMLNFIGKDESQIKVLCRLYFDYEPNREQLMSIRKKEPSEYYVKVASIIQSIPKHNKEVK